jgi:CRP-like cAMP-binding protein
MSYKKGQYIIREGESVSGIYSIKEGKIKVVSSGLNGKEQIVRLASDGHILGHRGYGGEIYPIGAVAIEDSLICFFNNDDLLNAFESNFNFIYQLMMFYSKELRKSELRIKYFAQMTVQEKVIFALNYIIETFGFDRDGKTINVTLKRQEIADIAGTNADQVGRTITFLKKQNLISTHGKKIRIENYESIFSNITQYTNGFTNL